MAVRCPQRALWGTSTAWGPLPSAHGEDADHPALPRQAQWASHPYLEFQATSASGLSSRLPPYLLPAQGDGGPGWGMLGGLVCRDAHKGLCADSMWVLQGTCVGVSTARLSLAEATLMWTLGHRCMAPASLTEPAPPWMGTGHGMGVLHILSRAGQVSGTSVKVAGASGGCSGLGDAGTGS